MQYIQIGNHHFNKSKIIGLHIRKSLFGLKYVLIIGYAQPYITIFGDKYTIINFEFRYKVKDYRLLLNDIGEFAEFPANRVVDTESLGIVHKLKLRKKEENMMLE